MKRKDERMVPVPFNLIPHVLSYLFRSFEEEPTLGPEISAERKLIKREAWEALSLEARLVASLILEAPGEFFRETGNITKSSINCFLREQCGWTIPKVKATFQELRIWVNNL